MKGQRMLLAAAMAFSLIVPGPMTTIVAQAEEKEYQPGVTVEVNQNSQWKAPYQATFVYDPAEGEKPIQSIELVGGFFWYKPDEVGNYQASGDNSSIPVYSAYEWEPGMFVANVVTDTADTPIYKMEDKDDDGDFEITIPLEGNLYFYDYKIQYEGEAEPVTVKDPANLPEATPGSGSDAGHSLVYVGDPTNTSDGQEYIYARNDQKGKVEWKSYTGADGKTQYLGVYTPYGYDPSKTYKTIYVSHGGGGNENEWMTIGAIPNIMDNLVAEGLTEPAVVVTMNNTYYGWDKDSIQKNILECIIPFVEANYSVSKNANDRAFCGLSAGSQVTNDLAMTSANQFGYFGSFSGGSSNKSAKDYDVDQLNKDVLYITAGNLDMAYNNNIGNSVKDFTAFYDSIGVEYDFDLLNGAHDWFVWRESFTNFAKDYLWTNSEPAYEEEITNTPSNYKAGVTVEENTEDQYVADYQLSFVYEDKDERNAVSVSVTGNFQFYDPNDEVIKNYTGQNDVTSATTYSVYDYQEGMFNTGYPVGTSISPYEMTQTEDERFEITLPVPGNLYYYDYVVTYDDGTTETIKDPANMPVANETNGHDAGHSLVYVGNAANTTAGQEYIYARDDTAKGSYRFVTYKAVDGTDQPLGIYVPANYDENKTYKTIYVSHGGGGQENEWMTIGAVPNIMDNLIADKEVAEAIVVTMDNTYFSWNYDDIKKNLMDNIIPYIEANYSVSTEAEDRAFCGLSMGGLTTTSIYATLSDQFGYLGIWSATDASMIENMTHDGDEPTLFLAAGKVDFGKAGFAGLKEALDQAGVAYTYEESLGAHDWGVWRDLFTRFAKNYLWDAESDPTPTPTPTPDPGTETPDPSDPDVTVDDPSDSTTATDTVQTGDNTSITVYVAGASMALVAIVVGIVIRKKKSAILK